jgi:hypothetical protein
MRSARTSGALFLLTACGAANPTESSWVSVPPGVAVSIETRFKDGEPWTPTAQETEELLRQCPQITRYRVSKETSDFWLMEVQGKELSSITRIGAHLPEGTLANASFQFSDDTLRFPVGCRACDLLFGRPAGDNRWAACVGVGFSLHFDQKEASSTE